MDHLILSPLLFAGFLGVTAIFAVSIVLGERRPVRASSRQRNHKPCGRS